MMNAQDGDGCKKTKWCAWRRDDGGVEQNTQRARDKFNLVEFQLVLGVPPLQ